MNHPLIHRTFARSQLCGIVVVRLMPLQEYIIIVKPVGFRIRLKAFAWQIPCIYQCLWVISLRMIPALQCAEFHSYSVWTIRKFDLSNHRAKLTFQSNESFKLRKIGPSLLGIESHVSVGEGEDILGPDPA